MPLTADLILRPLQVEESVSWIPPYDQEVPSLDIMSDWMQEGPRKKELEGETEFCSPKVLADVLNSKVSRGAFSLFRGSGA